MHNLKKIRSPSIIDENNEHGAESSLIQTISHIKEDKPIICKEHNDFVSLYCADDK